MAYNGVINVYKEPGYTSNDVVNILKRELKSKCGHTGTLDPQAEGVLPICVGKSTRLSDYIMGQTKKYRAEIHFGLVTDTQDIWGGLLADNRPVIVDASRFGSIAKSFIGKIRQVPPMYSAIKVNGQKLYDLARKGIEVERKAREVEIYHMEIIEFHGGRAVMDVECSKGTYIRALCHDIGEKLGTGAAMGRLIRLSSGNFHADAAVKLDEIKARHGAGEILDIMIPPEMLLESFERIRAKESAQKYIENGNALSVDLVEPGEYPAGQRYRLFDHTGRFIGLYAAAETGLLKPVVILTDLYANGAKI